MKKILSIVLMVLFLFGGMPPNPVLASTACGDISFVNTRTGQGLPTAVNGIPQKFVISPPSGRSFNTATDHIIDVENAGGPLGKTDSTIHVKTKVEGGKLVFDSGGNGEETEIGALRRLVVYEENRNSSHEICRISYRVAEHPAGCEISFEPFQPGVNQNVIARFRDITKPIGSKNRVTVYPNRAKASGVRSITGGYETTISGLDRAGTYRATFDYWFNDKYVPLCSADLKVGETPGEKQGEGTVTREETIGQRNPTKASEVKWCGTNHFGIETALGCIPVGDQNSFVGWFLKWALGIAGGIAFLLIIFAGFQIMSSTGNPDKIQSGKELLNAAISGLILIIFSVFLLKLIGVDILGLPGFGTP
ncbi:MAG: hypothetical protein HY376_04035 [Candidatus Blackburnbacteria bacterium]|nr:hypothetical protein [Candidatus Blackburnbacteria bacterium]